MWSDSFDTKQGGSVGITSTANENEGYSIYIKEWAPDSEDGVQCSPDEARMIAKGILRHADSVEMQRRADEERKEDYLKKESAERLTAETARD